MRADVADPSLSSCPLAPCIIDSPLSAQCAPVTFWRCAVDLVEQLQHPQVGKRAWTFGWCCWQTAAIAAPLEIQWLSAAQHVHCGKKPLANVPAQHARLRRRLRRGRMRSDRLSAGAPWLGDLAYRGLAGVWPRCAVKLRREEPI